MNIPETNGSFSTVQVHLTPQQLEPGQTATGRMAAATTTDNSQLSTDTVTLSEQAKAKAGDNGDEQQDSHLSGLTLEGQQPAAANEQSDVDAIDEQIEALQEKVRELTKQIMKLRAKNDEASIEQVKALESQLAQLNAQLMELTSQKLKMIEG